jgi:muramoyltetrapeptide carboxypeptidase
MRSAAVIAPSGPFEPTAFQAGLARIQPHFSVRLDPRLPSRFRYLAGDDTTRLAVLKSALSAEVIFAARGGSGAGRLLPQLSLPKQAPVLVGFSDITALHAHWQRHGQRSIHGPVLTQLGNQPDEVLQRLLALLAGDTGAPLTGTETIVSGTATGTLFGGNVSVICSLLGTGHLPDVRGGILLLEDIGERPYRLDRMWTQLLHSGLLNVVEGIAFGEFTSCEEKDADYSAREVLFDLAKALGKPCVWGFPIGHGTVNQPVVLGVPTRLDAEARTLTSLDSVYPSAPRDAA